MGHEESFAELRRFALGFPEATEDFPWGHTAIKVRGKVFAWLTLEDDVLGLTVKLPASRDFALIFDFAEPAGYGMGKHGWISSRVPPGEAADLELFRRWIAESFRAVAPKKLAATVPLGDQAQDLS